MQKYEGFEFCFTKFGSESNLSEDLFEYLEVCTACLYGVKFKSIDEARQKIFEKNMRSKNSSIYPYCLLAKVFWGSIVKEQTQLLIFGEMLLILQFIGFPSLTENGWTTTGDIEWIEEAFPAEVEELITRDEDIGENEDNYGSDVESSHDEDYDNVFWILKTVFMTNNLANF